METDWSRRTFLKGSAAATAAYLVGSPVIGRTVRASVIVVGAGAFGGWSALQLQRKGMKVTLLDAWGPGNSRASSGARLARSAPLMVLRTSYTRMVARALQLWQENERRWNLKLFFRSGALRMAGEDDSYERAALPVLQKAGVCYEKLSTPECAKRWP